MNAELHWLDVTTDLNGSFIEIITQSEIDGELFWAIIAGRKN